VIDGGGVLLPGPNALNAKPVIVQPAALFSKPPSGTAA